MTRQTGYTQYFSLIHLQIQASDGFAGHINRKAFKGDNGPIANIPFICAGFFHQMADHIPGQLVYGNIFFIILGHQPAIPQNRDPVADLLYLL